MGIEADSHIAPQVYGATTPRSLRLRFGDMPTIYDFGAKGDGSTDDTAAFTAAAAFGGPIYVPYTANFFKTTATPDTTKFWGPGSVKVGSAPVTLPTVSNPGPIPKAPASSQIIPAGYSLVIAGHYEIVAGMSLDIGAGATVALL